jgi:glycosyltransferase involved in cell wall biosynthesis
MMKLEPSWHIELHAPKEVFLTCFGTQGEPWMRPLPGAGYRQRGRWELIDLPHLLRSDPEALAWAPFGVPLNLALAPRTVWMSRNLIPLLPPREWELSPSDHLRIHLLRTLIVGFARLARGTICVSQHARARLASLARMDRARIAVAPHGVSAFVPGRSCSDGALEKMRQTKYVLHVGQPVPYRRTRELFAGYARLAARRSDLPPLVVAGRARPQDAAYEASCQHLLEPLVREGRAHLLGQIPHSDVLALLGSAHAFVYPSVHEDCPNVVLEALSAGRAGVFADIPAVRELADQAGVFVANPQPDTLAEAIERAVYDGPLRDRLGVAAQARAALFTWDRTAEKTVEIFERAFARAPMT